MSSTTHPRRLPFIADETARSYDGVFMLFHWTIVVLLIVQYLTKFLQWGGLWPNQSANYWHVSVGSTILLLMILRLFWRWIRPVPPPPKDLSLGLQVLSRATHWLLYAMVIIQGVVGWFVVSAYGGTGLLFGVIPLPRPMGTDKHLAHLMGIAHGWFALALLLVILVHASGGLYHAIFLRDGVIRRIVPIGEPGPP